MNLFELFAKVSLDHSEYDAGVTDVAKSGETLSNKLKTGFDKIKKGAAVVTGAVSAIGVGLLALEKTAEETRISQGKLATAFEAAGMGADAAKEAYNGFYGLLGDTDTATEASQLLAKLAENEQDISTWTNIAAGVMGTFGDSLPIESLIEASNETAKVGTVTGTLADALNWAGISEDEFNEKLAACTSESERNRLIMNTLSGTYDEAADAFYRNNEAIVKSRENQASLNESLAKVGEAVAKVKNAFLEQFAPAIDAVAEKAAKFISNLDPEEVAEKIQRFGETLSELLPIITGVTAATLAYKAAVAISSIIEGVTKATQGMTIAQAALNAVMNANPFVLVATLIAGLVTAIVTLWNTNDGFRDAVKAAWDKITKVFSSAWEAIKNVFSGWGDFFSGLWDKVTDIFGNVKEWFTNIGKNIVEGIKNGISNAWNSLKTWVTSKFQGLVDGVKSVLGIASPSKVFAGIGKNMALGVGEGWGDEFGRIKRDIEGGLDFGTARVDWASSGMAQSQRGLSSALQSVAASVGENINIVVQSVLDGKVIGETAYQYSRNKARAFGY